MKLLSKQALKLNITNGKQNRKSRSRLISFNLALSLTSCASSSKLCDLTNPWFPSLLKFLPPYRGPVRGQVEGNVCECLTQSLTHGGEEVMEQCSAPLHNGNGPTPHPGKEFLPKTCPCPLLLPSPLLTPCAPTASGHRLPGITVLCVIQCLSCPSDD